LGRPRSAAAQAAREVDRFSLAAMAVFAAVCLLAGILPGFIIDGLAPMVQSLVGGRLPAQTSQQWLSIVPVAENRSSYNELLIFLFISISASTVVFAIHRLASHALRRGAAWDCGHPDPSPATQYTAGSFAQPIRRVFGTIVFLAREEVTMPPPRDGRAARFGDRMRDHVRDVL